MPRPNEVIVDCRDKCLLHLVWQLFAVEFVAIKLDLRNAEVSFAEAYRSKKSPCYPVHIVSIQVLLGHLCQQFVVVVENLKENDGIGC